MTRFRIALARSSADFPQRMELVVAGALEFWHRHVRPEFDVLSQAWRNGRVIGQARLVERGQVEPDERLRCASVIFRFRCT